MRFYLIASCSSAGRRGLFSGRGENTKLSKKAQQIQFGPLFSNLAVCYAIDENPCIGDLLPRRWHPLKRAQVGSLKTVAHHHLVSLGDLILNRVMHIGEGCTHTADKLPVLIDSM